MMAEYMLLTMLGLAVLYAPILFFKIMPYLPVCWRIVITFVVLLLFYRIFYYSPWVPKEEFKDTRDGKKYKSVKIGEQIWMAENLNYDAEDSKCYNDSIANCEKYGRLYKRETAMKACPSGWHLPSKEEWETLRQFINEPSCSSTGLTSTCDKTAKFLKAVSGWGLGSNGDDKFGFAAIPSGRYSDRFEYGGYSCDLWSATKHYYLTMSVHHDFATLENSGGGLLSVRCLKDN